MKALPALALTAPLAWGIPATTNLGLVSEAGFNEINITLDVPGIGASSDTSTLTGAVLVEMEIHPVTNRVSELSVISGNIVGTGVTLSKSILLAQYSVTASSIGADVFTPTPPGAVDPPSGNFDASQHDFVVNDGQLNGSFRVGFTTTPISFNFATDPITGAGSGTGNVSLVPAASTPTSQSYDATVLLPVSIVDVYDAGDGILVDVTASGTVKATGSVTINFTPYEFWTYAEGIPGAPFLGDENGDTVVNGLVWALGLASTDDPLPLLPVVTTTGVPVATISLPTGGSAAPLVVQGASSPGGPWIPVASTALSTGLNPIPAGTSGPVTYTFPAGDGGFTRLEVAEP